MPRLDKAMRRDKKRERDMEVSGRGLLTDTPNWDRRKDKERSMRKRKNRGKRE